MKAITSRLPHFSKKLSYSLLRSVLGIIFISHGLARIYYWSIEDFGLFLNSKGFVVGVFIAWLITIGEILGGILFLVGRKVKHVVLFNFLVVTSGIFLVHIQNGWFVVGHGQNGIEYSILILSVLLFIYSHES